MYFRGNTDVASYLIEKGASIEMKANGGETALHFATKSGHEEIVKVCANSFFVWVAKTVKEFFHTFGCFYSKFSQEF